jgi:hypothetical protein
MRCVLSSALLALLRGNSNSFDVAALASTEKCVILHILLP